MKRYSAPTVSAAVLVVVWIGLQIHSAFTHTPTHDECWHLPIGVAIWQSGDFDQDRINPPLVRVLAAAPYAMFGSDVDFSEAERDTDYARIFVGELDGDARHVYAAGRIVVILWMLGGVMLLADLARRAVGREAGLFVLLFALTDPNIAANSALVTHDAPAGACFVAMAWTLVRFWSLPAGMCRSADFALSASWHLLARKWAAVVGIVLGVSLLTKFTSLIWCPIVVGVFVARQFGEHRLQWHQTVVTLAICVGTAMTIVNIGYLFEGTGRPLESYVFESTKMQSTAGILSGLAAVPLPLPRDFVLGIDRLLFTVESPHTSYLNGLWQLTGFRTYYLWCWLYKTPIILQLASLVGVGVLVARWRSAAGMRATLTIAIAAIALVVIPASLSGNQLGYRYVLPVYPFAILFAACGVGLWFQTERSKAKPKLAVVIALVCLLSLRYHPHHLTYFNEIAGGPAGGPEHLLDSNVDWGQSLHLLQDYLDETGLELDGLAYYGTFPTDRLGLDAPLPRAFLPEAGRFAVSVNFVHGRPHVVQQADGSIESVAIGSMLYFKAFPPLRVIGNSIAVYEISEIDAAEYREVFREMSQDFPR